MTVETIQAIVGTLFYPLVLGLGGWGVTILKKHGYQATYAAALVRAVGAGQQAAQAAGLTIFTASGRDIAVIAGTKYLIATVAPEAAKLGIGDADHAVRVAGEIGALNAQAQAVAHAAPIAVADLAASLLSAKVNQVTGPGVPAR